MSEAPVLRLLVFAMGGEGGLTLSRWIAEVAEAAGYDVQYTSLPGVAQRTGATSYYFELVPPSAEVHEKEPVLGLEPSVGDVDIVLASELLEAARAVERGFVTPDRTSLIASTHREYLLSEKSDLGDGLLSDSDLIKRIEGACRNLVSADLKAVVHETGARPSAVLFGALAGSSALPFPVAAYEAVLAGDGIADQQNVAGFKGGLAAVRGEGNIQTPVARGTDSPDIDLLIDAGWSSAIAELPTEAAEFARLGVQRLIDYQDRRYAGLYLDRLKAVCDLDGSEVFGKEVARILALWMAFEDVMRVAQQKTRATRIASLRSKAGVGELVRITDFLRPGIEEVGSLLPAALGRRVVQSAALKRWWERWVPPLKIQATGLFGFSALFFLRSLKRFRRITYRYQREQTLIGRWLEAVSSASSGSPTLALEVAKCATLVKGYGTTRRRGEDKLAHILEQLPAARLRADGAEMIAGLHRAAQAGESVKSLTLS